MAETSLSIFDREKVMKELEENGYSVIPEVLSVQECDNYVEGLQDWLSDLPEGPSSMNSVIHSYRIGHFQSIWECRMKVKHIFASIWGTEKLLTSMDGAAIGPPPESGIGEFCNPLKFWLHCDQGPYRQGLHAYQGALYLEETTDSDYCFRVMAKSHKFHKDVFGNAFGISRWKGKDFCKLNKCDVEWFESKGCPVIKVPVPKGGMVLWDSRTIHDNIKPEYGRPNTDRWRYVFFISMTPAMWASRDDLMLKRQAYKKFLTTAHWSSQGTRNFREYKPKPDSQLKELTEMPKVAQTPEARLMAGVDEYDFEDGQPNGPNWEPQWINGDRS